MYFHKTLIIKTIITKTTITKNIQAQISNSLLTKKKIHTLHFKNTQNRQKEDVEEVTSKNQVKSKSKKTKSALYISSDKASSNFSVVTPFLDFPDNLNEQELENNLKNRGHEKTTYNQIKSLQNVLKNMKDELQIVEKTRQEITNQLKEVRTKNNNNDKEDTINRLKTSASVIKQEYKQIKQNYQRLEEEFALKILELPNVLHKSTPVNNNNNKKQEEEAIFQFISQKKTTTKNLMMNKNEIEIQNENEEKNKKLHSTSLIENENQKNAMQFFDQKKCKESSTKNPNENETKNYYSNLKLKLNSKCKESEEALFELRVFDYFQRMLLEKGFTQFSNCDFVKSVILEGCGHSFSSLFSSSSSSSNLSSSSSCSSSNLTLSDDKNDENSLSRNHLVGGASLYSFMAYFTRHFIQNGYLPLKLFSFGRQYNAAAVAVEKMKEKKRQCSALQIFVALKDDDLIEDRFLNEELINDILINRIFKGFFLSENLNENLSFRIVKLPSCQLNKAESLRISIQIGTLPKNENLREESENESEMDWVEVGYISAYDKYLSKRLLFTYSENNKKEKKFLRVISGTLINVQKVFSLVSLINNDQFNV